MFKLLKLYNTKGQAMIEFALIVPILLTMVFGIIEFGNLYTVKLSIDSALREGVRTASVQTTADDSAILTSIQTVRADITSGYVTISPSDSTRASGDNVTITINYPYNTLTGFLDGVISLFSGGSLTVSANITGYVE